MRARVVAALAVLVLGTGLVARPPRAEADASAAPPSPETTSPGPDGSVHHTIELAASRVDLGHLGVHTHANWVVFELPFDVTDPAVRHIRFSPRTLVDTDVGAYPLPLGIGCVRAPSIGPVTSPEWTKFTKDGTAGTLTWADHSLAPTGSGRAYAINVPTRVANAAACGMDALRRADVWRLSVAWDTVPR